MDPEGFDLPDKVKVPDLPRVGRNKEERPYYLWEAEARALFAAAQGVDVILERGIPPLAADPRVQRRYAHANNIVFAALMRATVSVPVLSDTVRRLQGSVASGRRAWVAIRAHFVRLADDTESLLLGELQAIAPRAGEEMERFLNRCHGLREKFGRYNVPFPEDLLVQLVCKSIGRAWLQSSGLLARKVDLQAVGHKLPWSDVCSMLQKEDNGRRCQTDFSAHDAMLPLGWTRDGRPGRARGASGEAQEPGYESERGGSSSGPQGPPAAHAAGGSQGEGKKRPPREGEGRSGNRGSWDPKYLVCFYCLQSGHGIRDCPDPKKPKTFVVSQERKEKAAQLRRELWKAEQDQAQGAAAQGQQGPGQGSDRSLSEGQSSQSPL
jgi:hypothetical protein